MDNLGSYLKRRGSHQQEQERTVVGNQPIGVLFCEFSQSERQEKSLAFSCLIDSSATCLPPFGGKFQGGQACSAWKNKPDPVIWGNLGSTFGTTCLFLGIPCFSRSGKTPRTGYSVKARGPARKILFFSPNLVRFLVTPKLFLTQTKFLGQVAGIKICFGALSSIPEKG